MYVYSNADVLMRLTTAIFHLFLHLPAFLRPQHNQEEVAIRDVTIAAGCGLFAAIRG